MSVFYDFIKVIFFSLTVIVGLFYLRGRYFLEGTQYSSVSDFLMPGYLIVSGIMVGYLIAHVWFANAETGSARQTSIYIKSFMIGIVIGIGLAVSYIYL